MLPDDQPGDRPMQAEAQRADMSTREVRDLSELFFHEVEGRPDDER